MTITRRQTILGSTAAIAVAALPSVPAQAATIMRRYDAYRGRKRFGQQAISLKEDGSSLIVDLHTRLKGRVLVFNFDYEVRSQEVWRDGVLQNLRATAREGDKKFFVNATRSSAGLDVKSSKFNGIATGELTTSSIFMADLAKRPRWLSTQSGRVFDVKANSKGKAFVETPQGRVECTHYYCAGNMKVPLDAYYSQTGELVSYEFDAVGARARVVAQTVDPAFHTLWP